MKLTEPQSALLAELAEGNGLYIRRYGKFFRTAEALERRALVRIDEPDHSQLGQDHYVVTDAGRALLDVRSNDQ